MDGALQDLRRRVEASPEDHELVAVFARALARAGDPLAPVYEAGLLCAPSVFERVAAEDGPVLVVGGDAPSRERVTRTIHALGPRREAAWVGLSPEQLPETLLESELFGRAVGGFGGTRAGALEGRRTFLFMGDVEQVSRSIQRGLRLIVRTRRVCRQGDREARPADTRLVAGSGPGLGGVIGFDPELADLLGRCVLRLADSVAGASSPGAS